MSWGEPLRDHDHRVKSHKEQVRPFKTVDSFVGSGSKHGEHIYGLVRQQDSMRVSVQGMH
jgi:hypothetical protein